MTYRRKLVELESSIQTLIKTASKTQQNNLGDFEELLSLLNYQK